VQSSRPTSVPPPPASAPPPGATTNATPSPAAPAPSTAQQQQQAARQAAELRRLRDAERQKPIEPPRETPEAGRQDYASRYKSLERRWVRAIIALPIFFVTSYFLFDRGTLYCFS
jgi:hypothetical protein